MNNLLQSGATVVLIDRGPWDKHTGPEFGTDIYAESLTQHQIYLLWPASQPAIILYWPNGLEV